MFVFQRLAQHFKDVLAEFRQFIQEQYAAVGKRYLTWVGQLPPPTSPA